jgi:RecA-family ATPase
MGDSTLGTKYSDLESLDYEWLWNGVIVKGEVTILAGDSGAGKGFLVADIVSTVTNGGMFPRDLTERDAAGAVMIGLEESAEYTTIHKLRAAGADFDRVIDLSHVDSASDYTASGSGEFTIQAKGGGSNLPELRKVLEREANAGRPVGVVVMDPLSAMVDGALSSNTGSRDIMSSLRNVARDWEVAILVVHHPVKGRSSASGTGLSVKDRIAGSKGLTDAARLVLGLDLDTETGERILSVVKANICDKNATPYRFQLTKDWPMRVEWMDELADDTPAADVGIEPAEGTEAWKVLNTLREHGGPMNVVVLAAKAHVKATTARSNLSRLRERGLVVACERGMYDASVLVPDALGDTEPAATVRSTWSRAWHPQAPRRPPTS